MPFRFVCVKCGKIVYEDATPDLRLRGNYALKEDYLERVLDLIGQRCSCGHVFSLPPEKIDVYPLKKGAKGEENFAK